MPEYTGNKGEGIWSRIFLSRPKLYKCTARGKRTEKENETLIKTKKTCDFSQVFNIIYLH